MESLDTKILKILEKYREKNPGDPEINFYKLCRMIPDATQREIRDEIDKLREDNLISTIFTTDGFSGLVSIKRKGSNLIKLEQEAGGSDQEESFNKEIVVSTDVVEKIAESKSDYKHEMIESQKSKQNSRPVVFLAEVSNDLDLEEKRKEVKRALEQEKFRVFPINPLTLGESDTFRDTVNKELERCEIFVQLLGEWPATPCKDKLTTTYDYIQFEQAKRAKKMILQWRDRNLDISRITDKNHKLLLENEFVIADNFATFKNIVIKKSQSFSKNRAKPLSPKPVVIINANRVDELLARQIQELLMKYELHHELLIEKETSQEYSNELERCLDICDGSIIIYGETPVEWVDILLRKYLHFIKQPQQRPKPLKAALYEGPPAPKSKPTVYIRDMVKCECHTGLDEQKLWPFLDALTAGETA